MCVFLLKPSILGSTLSSLDINGFNYVHHHVLWMLETFLLCPSCIFFIVLKIDWCIDNYNGNITILPEQLLLFT